MQTSDSTIFPHEKHHEYLLPPRLHPHRTDGGHHHHRHPHRHPAAGHRRGFTSGEKAQARTEIMGLEGALRKFYDDYNKFPPGTGEPRQEATESLARLLSGVNEGGNNPREKMYMEFKPSSIANGKFVDPWGKPYLVATDTNLDGETRADPSKPGVRRRVLVWSGGPDGLDSGSGNESKDNVASW
jgi:hypothetical protein